MTLSTSIPTPATGETPVISAYDPAELKKVIDANLDKVAPIVESALQDVSKAALQGSRILVREALKTRVEATLPSSAANVANAALGGCIDAQCNGSERAITAVISAVVKFLVDKIKLSTSSSIDRTSQSFPHS